MRGYEVPIVLFVAADYPEEALERARKIADTMKGKHDHGYEIPADSQIGLVDLVLIPELGA